MWLYFSTHLGNARNFGHISRENGAVRAINMEGCAFFISVMEALRTVCSSAGWAV
jgi:hypothetical protein